MARKKKAHEHVNHERWMVSWADFMTLLFALFTSLYAISTADPKKAGAMAESTRAAFSLSLTPGGKPQVGGRAPSKSSNAQTLQTPTDSSAAADSKAVSLKVIDSPKETAMMQEALKKLEAIVPLLPIRAGITLHASKNTIVVSLKDKAFFRAGSAQMLPEALPVLDKLAEVLVTSHLFLRVEGHTDDRPSSNRRYTSNWDLSAARAVSVVRYLADEYAYPPESLAVAGYASGHPLGDNSTAEGRSANRRVDIVLLTQPDVPGLKDKEAGSSHVAPPEKALAAPPHAQPPVRDHKTH